MRVLVNYKNVESSNMATTTIMPRIQFISLALRESFPSLNNQPTAQISNTPTNINICYCAKVGWVQLVCTV